MNDSNSAPAAAPGPVAGLAIVAIVVVLVIAWAVLGTMLFSDLTLFGGFLLLWHWANLEQLEIKRMPATIAGALVGIGLAWQVVYLTQQMGSTGTIIGLLVMIAAIYIQIINVMPMLFNAAAMLFLTVAAAPLIQLKVDFAELALSTVVAGLFFGALVEGLKRAAARFGGGA
ncbi:MULTISPECIES: hypothetical protein [unclassified Novosphingobium]|uniref:hypothetical protein n=1 Tax=unclassified Novosphingobium TaxID=2644732 RepID=UPI0025D8FF9C|nr:MULTISPECIES: hypothetical protein [unclassified Novosphingobium]HQV04852.1 hypothetical protein [Novosphingobium sp.]